MRPELLERVPVTLTAHSKVVTAVIEAYVEERGRLLGARTQAFEGFLRLLVAPQTPLAVIERRAAALRLRLDLCRSIVLFRPLASGDDHAAEANVGAARRTGGATQREGALIGLGRFEKDVLALLALEPVAQALADLLARVPAHEWRIGIGMPARELEPAPGRLRRAARRRIGRIVRPSERIHPTPTSAPRRRHVGSSTAEEYAARVLGALRAPVRAPRTAGHSTPSCVTACSGRSRPQRSHPPPHAVLSAQPFPRRFGIDLDDYEVRLRVELALLILGATDGAPAS